MPDSPPTPESLFEQGLTLHQKGDFATANEFYQQVLARVPKHFDALHLSGVIAMQTGDNAQAVSLISKALAINPGDPNYGPAYNNRGIAYRALFRNEAAIDNFDKALELGHADPAVLADIHFNRASALKDLKRTPAAIAGFDRVIALQPQHGVAFYRRGQLQLALGRVDDAIVSFRRAADINPGNHRMHAALGMALTNANRYGAAVEAFRKAVEANPADTESQNNLGISLRAVGQREASLLCYIESLKHDTTNPDTYVNQAATLIELGRHGEAIAAYDHALALAPDYAFLKGLRLHSKMYVCDWSEVKEDTASLIADIEAGKAVTPSWPVLALTDSLPVQRRSAEIWARERHTVVDVLGPIPAAPRRDKIRMGYYSADFFNHATAHLTAGLFEAHDRDRFEINGFSFGPQAFDEMRKRLFNAFDTFIDVSLGSNREIATLSRERGIDIAVDLKGFTTGERAGIFAHRAAPVQVNFLGYPGTMGVPYMDYIIADRTVLPREDFSHYAEKVVWMPHTYQVNDNLRRIGSRVFSRKHAGLPEEGFVFCCFNNNFKITPEIFAVWMRILARVPGSVLWLLEDNAMAAINLRREAAGHGIEPTRLVFARRIPTAEHLARQNLAGLFLDTPIYNAHTTASDALWAGLPVLTCPGRAFAARVAASVLGAAGLGELVVQSLGDYEDMAVTLANDPKRLKQLREKLAAELERMPLFDTPLFTKHIEQAYTRMAERRAAGLAPEHIAVEF